MKKILLACFLLATCTACAPLADQSAAVPETRTQEPVTEPDPFLGEPTGPIQRPNVPTALIQAEFTHTYKTYEELADAAEIVIEGTVVEATPTPYHPPDDPDHHVAYTKVKVKVAKSFTDSIKRGDIITFAEFGGVIPQKLLNKGDKTKLTEADLQDKVNMRMDGIDVMAVNERVLLFASAPKRLKLFDEPYYSVLGIYQGKFKINDGLVAREAPPNAESWLPSLQMKRTDAEKIIQERMKHK